VELRTSLRQRHAYLATLRHPVVAAAIAGGIELYGNLQLSAFGIHVGLTATLLEGSAPIHFGSRRTERGNWIFLALPNIGATISLTGAETTAPCLPHAGAEPAERDADRSLRLGRQAGQRSLCAALARRAAWLPTSP